MRGWSGGSNSRYVDDYGGSGAYKAPRYGTLGSAQRTYRKMMLGGQYTRPAFIKIRVFSRSGRYRDYVFRYAQAARNFVARVKGAGNYAGHKTLSVGSRF